MDKDSQSSVGVTPIDRIIGFILGLILALLLNNYIIDEILQEMAKEVEWEKTIVQIVSIVGFSILGVFFLTPHALKTAMKNPPQPKNCPECGKVIKEKVAFCPYCRSRLADSNSAGFFILLGCVFTILLVFPNPQIRESWPAQFNDHFLGAWMNYLVLAVWIVNFVIVRILKKHDGRAFFSAMSSLSSIKYFTAGVIFALLLAPISEISVLSYYTLCWTVGFLIALNRSYTLAGSSKRGIALIWASGLSLAAGYNLVWFILRAYYTLVI